MDGGDGVDDQLGGKGKSGNIDWNAAAGVALASAVQYSIPRLGCGI